MQQLTVAVAEAYLVSAPDDADTESVYVSRICGSYAEVTARCHFIPDPEAAAGRVSGCPAKDAGAESAAEPVAAYGVPDRAGTPRRRKSTVLLPGRPWRLIRKNDYDRNVSRLKLKVFQSQINSHFLFNTLNIISKLAYIEDAPRTQNASDLLAQFLRSVLSQFSRTITLAEEFETVDQYVKIQKLRFGSRIAQPSGRGGTSEEDCRGSSSVSRGSFFRRRIPPRHRCLKNVCRRLSLLYPGGVQLHVQAEKGDYTEFTLKFRSDHIS